MIPKSGTADDSLPASQDGKTESDEDLAAPPDHDVPNELVIEKTLPEPNHDGQDPL